MLDVYYLENTNRNFNDMYLCYCGFEKCTPLHSFGPAIRPNYLYTVTKNEGFLINPNVITFYEADEEEPWTYLWIGIDGNKVKTYLKCIGLDEENLIFKCDEADLLKEYVMEMLKHHKSTDADSFKIEGLYFSLGCLTISKAPFQMMIQFLIIM